MNIKTIKDYRDLNRLFFRVLAVPVDERETSIKEKFKNVP